MKACALPLNSVVVRSNSDPPAAGVVASAPPLLPASAPLSPLLPAPSTVALVSGGGGAPEPRAGAAPLPLANGPPQPPPPFLPSTASGAGEERPGRLSSQASC